MRKLLVIILLGWLCNAPAQANAIYSWVALSEVGNPRGGLPSFPGLTFSDSVIANGSYTFQCGPFDCPTGVNPDLGGLKWGGSGIVHVNFDVHFNADGTLTGHTSYLDMFAEYDLGGSEFDWSGTHNSDFYNCRDPSPCQVTGYWKGNPIPEPAPWSLLLVGLGVVAFFGRARLRART